MENNEITMTGVDFNTQKKTIVKCLRILTLCAIASLCANVLCEIPVIGDFFEWVSRVVSLVPIYALFCLRDVNKRYRKASIFCGISAVGNIISFVLDLNIFISLLLAVCTLIASFQEYNGHSELSLDKDEKQAKRWRSLFYIELFGGILTFVAGITLVAFALASDADTAVVSTVTGICVAIITVLFKALYILYLKKTISFYR